jgi:hypothetical protein
MQLSRRKKDRSRRARERCVKHIGLSELSAIFAMMLQILARCKFEHCLSITKQQIVTFSAGTA